MVKETIRDTAAQKAFLLLGSGATVMGLNQNQTEMLALGVIGVILGALSYIYDFTHKNKQTNTKWQTISEASRYIVFGGFAMPSITLEAGSYVDKEATQVLIGALISWAIVDISSTITDKIKDLIKGWQK
jgi:uncharacterized membrane protein HdeD (DUF308 family)